MIRMVCVCCVMLSVVQLIIGGGEGQLGALRN